MNAILSMTGYGCGKNTVAGKIITVEIKSVNSRYFDISYRTPRAYSKLEDRIKNAVNAVATRGKIEVGVSYELTGDAQENFVSVNHEYLANYISCLNEIADKYELANDISVMRVASNRDVFCTARANDDAETLWAELEPALCEATQSFALMKKTEGGKMFDDVTQKLGGVEKIIAQIGSICPETLNNYEERLKARIEEYTKGIGIDEGRILTEIAIFADKIAIDEELVRLGSHIKQFYSICDRDDNTPVGRKLDFLLQEINREINTIGSKSNNADIAKLVVEAKSEAEKIREQIQNIE